MAAIRAERARRTAEAERARLDRDAELIRSRCQRLAGFIREAWHVLEPNAPLVWNWHLDAFCAHLEAVTAGRLNRLLINVPPGSSKSLVVSVLWPAWEWGPMGRRSLRYLTTAFNDGPVTRDTRKMRDLVLSPWYRRLWPEVVLSRAGETSFANTATGTREGVPFGSLTSQRGDRLICFPAWEVIETAVGPLTIGEIVESRMQVDVWSTDPATGTTSLKPIKAWVKNPGSDLVEVMLSDGSSVVCTPDHRIWTTRGWVAAASLCASDRLPITPDFDQAHRALGNAVAGAENAIALTGMKNGKRVVGGDLRPGRSLALTDVARSSAAVGELAPGLAPANLLDRVPLHPQPGAKRIGGLVALRDLARTVAGEAGVAPALVSREGAMVLRVGDVGAPGAVFEVLQSAVRRIAVEVAALLPGRRRAAERQQHALVHEPHLRLAAEAGVKARVTALPGRRAFQDSRFDGSWNAVSHGDDALFGADAPEIADAVQAVEAGYRTPLFVRNFGHVNATYCLTVADYHTFYAGSGNRVLVANCDDPHSTETAESPAERARTIRKFREGAINRLNDQERSAIVVVMQRLHEDDISGVIQKLGMGYTHLCLPMEFEVARACRTPFFTDPRSQEGELLDPVRFPRETVEALKRDAGSYAYAGQYQQRPAPREGGLFKRAWFEGKIITAAPAGTVWVRHWDLAATKRANAARTAGVKMGRTPDGRYVVGHVVTEQEDGAAVRRVIRATAEADTAAVMISLPQDPGQAGKVQAADFVTLLAGFTVRTAPETGDKITRAEPFSAQCEAGNVSLVRGAWNEAYLDELCQFPSGTFADQVDASSGAFGQLVRRQSSPPGSGLQVVRR